MIGIMILSALQGIRSFLKTPWGNSGEYSESNDVKLPHKLKGFAKQTETCIIRKQSGVNNTSHEDEQLIGKMNKTKQKRQPGIFSFVRRTGMSCKRAVPSKSQNHDQNIKERNKDDCFVSGDSYHRLRHSHSCESQSCCNHKEATMNSPQPYLSDEQKLDTDVEVVNRCDNLINQTQTLSQTYFKLEEACIKIKKRFHVLAILNVLLIIFVSGTVVGVLLPSGHKPDDKQTLVIGLDESISSPFEICFNCSDLHQGTVFSLETLYGVRQRKDNCCFESIASVMRSLNRNLLKDLDDKLQEVKEKLSELGKRLLMLEVDAAPDKNTIIGNFLQVLAPRERTALYLTSVRDTLFVETPDTYNLYTLRWSTADHTVIKRGSLELSDDETSIRVTSEGYYFFYTRIKFRHKEKATYKRQTPLRYLVYRRRGSISSYLHEATINCVFHEMSQEHSSTSEMILHLNKDDELFVTVEESDKNFLSTDASSHSVGLFEI